MPKITIKGHVFDVPVHYIAGHVLDENEASALDSLRRENIKANLVNVISKMIDDKASDDAVEMAFRQYYNTYHFATPRTETQKPSAIDVEARRFAKSALLKALRSQKIDPYKDLAEGELEGRIDAMLAANPSIRESAAKRVAELQEIAREALGE